MTDPDMAARTRLARAQRGDAEAFAQLTDPHRRELQLHCYRILGSLQDAEDLLQETLLAAWQALEQFEGRSSLRAWLYTIATNRCLNALRERRRRPTISTGAPSTSFGEVAWLQPYPDTLLDGVADLAPGPEARYEAKESVALAFVSGLQHLAPRQRAVLVLRDVLGFRADEVAEMLGASVASVTSALQRARATLDARVPVGRERLRLPDAGDDDLVARFADAFQRDDIEALVAMLAQDAVVSMPPQPEWFQGRDTIATFLGRRAQARGVPWRLVPLSANRQPALAYFMPADDGSFRAAGLFVLSVRAGAIESITRFAGRELMSRFGVAEQLG